MTYVVYFSLCLNHPEVSVHAVFFACWLVMKQFPWVFTASYIIPEPCGGGRGHSDSWLRASGEARGNVISHVKGPFTHVLFINGDAITEMHCSWRRCWWRHFYVSKSAQDAQRRDAAQQQCWGACGQTSGCSIRIIFIFFLWVMLISREHGWLRAGWMIYYYIHILNISCEMFSKYYVINASV